MEMDSKVACMFAGRLTYHFSIVLVSVLQNNPRHVVSSTILLDEHHKLNDNTWFAVVSFFAFELGVFLKVTLLAWEAMLVHNG